MSTDTTPHPANSIFAPQVVAELERFASGYDALCAELFDDDPVLSTHIAPPDVDTPAPGRRRRSPSRALG